MCAINGGSGDGGEVDHAKIASGHQLNRHVLPSGRRVRVAHPRDVTCRTLVGDCTGSRLIGGDIRVRNDGRREESC